MCQASSHITKPGVSEDLFPRIKDLTEAYLKFTVTELKGIANLVRRHKHILNNMALVVVVANGITLQADKESMSDSQPRWSSKQS